MRQSKISIIGKWIALLLYSPLLAQTSPQESLEALMEGNTRYTQDQSLHPNRGQEQRSLLYAQQNPFAVIVGCSDSRAAPEIIFDQGIGDLFVVRVAGNVVGPLEIDSIDYAALALGSSVILVMGHENCGAVAAVIEGQTKEIEAVAKLIEPAVRQTKGKKDQLYWATVANAVRMKKIIQKSPVIQKLMKQGKIEVSAAYYHFESGKVDLIPD